MTQDSTKERRRKHMAVMDDKEKGTKAMTEQVKDAIASLKHLVECHCDEAYTGRGRHDPHNACDYAEEVKIVTDHIEELGAQLKMALEREAETQARHDRKMNALEAKLAKAVAVLQAFKIFDDLPLTAKHPDVFERRVRHPILVAIAEIEGETK